MSMATVSTPTNAETVSETSIKPPCSPVSQSSGRWWPDRRILTSDDRELIDALPPEKKKIADLFVEKGVWTFSDK